MLLKWRLKETWQARAGGRVERMETSYFVQELRVKREGGGVGEEGFKRREGEALLQIGLKGRAGRVEGLKGRREGFTQRRLEGKGAEGREGFKGGSCKSEDASKERRMELWLRPFRL